jgi:tRNA-specific 2-thiouridylase
VDRDFKKNRLIVTNDENDPAICKKSMLVEIKKWVAEEPKMPLEINVKIRYRHPLVRGILNKVTSHKSKVASHLYEVEFLEPQKAVTPGQSAVFYADDNEVLGGGIII